AAKSSDIDIIRVDIVWPGILKDHLLDLKPYSQGQEAEHFPAIVANNTVNGRLLGMPWFTDTGLLYYRTDLLQKYKRPPPTTWDELAATAAIVQAGERAAGQKDFQGFVFQAKSSESLTCNAIEWIASYGGGRLVDEQGNITVNNPQAARALATAAKWVGSISSVGVLNYAEEDARGVFQNGQALFMRNWPYAWALSESPDSLVRGKVGVSPLPRGEGAGANHAGTLGGWQMSVSRYSKSPEVAASLVMYMTSAAVQKDRAIRFSFNPTRPALYQDAQVIAANAFMASLLPTFQASVARPSGQAGLKYPAVSLALTNAAHDVLARKTTPEAALRKLEGQLKLVRRERW
ncbi:MAG: ABC transporter substrate-binding protein, partial [Burkholderiales bacterium PBB5]